MSLTEKILKHIQEETEWSELSLSGAMRGMEEESSPYSLNDIKERFT